jgi:UDP-N-acetyl-2-amino-2-deoxyglucuronate dehydrogenase
MTLAIHGIDLLQWMMGGEIVEVFGISDNLKHKEIEIDDIGLAVLKFKNGSYGLIEGTSNIYPENLEETLYIFGESGTVKLGGKSVNRIDEWKFDDNIDKKSNIKKEYSEKPLNVYGFGHDPLYKDIIDSIINNKNPFVMPEDGRKAVALILSIYESAKKRKPIKIDNGI